MSHLFANTFFEFGVVENFFRTRITVILTLQIHSIRLHESVTMTVCSIMMTYYYFRFCPLS